MRLTRMMIDVPYGEKKVIEWNDGVDRVRKVGVYICAAYIIGLFYVWDGQFGQLSWMSKEGNTLIHSGSHDLLTLASP